MFSVFCIYVCYTGLSVPSSLVVTCLEWDDLLALLCVIFVCVLSLSHIFSGSGVALLTFASFLTFDFFTSGQRYKVLESSKRQVSHDCVYVMS